LWDERADIREGVALVIGEIGDVRAAVGPLARIVEFEIEKPQVRLAAIVALGQSSSGAELPSQVIGPLLTAIRDVTFPVNAAVNSLRLVLTKARSNSSQANFDFLVRPIL
jgi:hypothetical protein